MRNLASVVTIKTKQKMFEKDKICCVSFEELGYEAIVPNTFNVGDKLVFIQEGAILPETETWEFLRKRCYKEQLKGFLISPMTMGAKEITDENGNPAKGERVRSWGLAVGLNECGLTEGEIRRLKPGVDVTDALQIRKYEPIEDASPKGDSKKTYPKWVKFCLSHAVTRWIGKIWQKNHQNTAGGFPTNIISKSDESTIQNMPSVIERFKDEFVYTSIKMEGQSATALFGYDFNKNKLIDKGFYVCSRNNAYKLRCNNTFWETANRLDIENQLRKYYKETGKALVIQCEQVGPGIQDNIYDLKFNDWYVYTIKDEVTGKQLPLEEMLDVCKTLKIKSVPIIEKNVRLGDIMPTVEAAVAYAENQFWRPINGEGEYGPIDPFYKPRNGEKLWRDYFQHEGVVVRTMNYDKDSNVGTSFKVKNCNYGEQNLGNIHAACVKVKSTFNK